MPTTPTSFGNLLRTLRKRVGMTQGDLAAAVGYSVATVSALEQARRLPDVTFVVQHLVPALALTDAPQLATRLVELAAATRGERPPTTVTVQRATQVVIHEAVVEGPRRLPAPPTTLLGRTAQVNQLCDRLLGHGGRLLTLVGPPGIGKTTLALAVAGHLHPHYPDGAVFVALAAINEPTLMAATIATAVGCSDASAKPPQTRLIEFLRRKTMLLVLDNLEQIGGAAPLIAELVAECPGLCVLATSRERLHLRAEQRYQVPPLDLAPAVELFTRRAQAVNADFTLTPHNRPAVEAICQRLDCLPLALELCAAQVDLLSPAQLLAHLQERRLDLLVEGATDLPPRQRTLRTAIGHSYALLNEKERTLFRRLGVFVGGFDLAAVEMVGAWSQETGTPSRLSTLHALIGKSLVRAATTPEGEQRFLLLETIREFALEQLWAQGEEALLRQRHYAAYLHLFRTADSHLRGPKAATWRVRLVPEQDNLRAALQWTLDEAHYVDAAWLIVAAISFWEQRGDGYEPARWLAQLLPHRNALAIDLRLAIFIILHASSRDAPGEFQPLSRYIDEIMELQEVSSDKLLQSLAWYFLAVHYSDFLQKAAILERSIALARLASDLPGPGPEFCLLNDRDFVLGTALYEYARRLVRRGEFARAESLARESVMLFQARGNRYERAGGLGTLGLLAFLQGDLVQAHTYLHEAVTIVEAVNSQLMLGIWQPLLGIVTLYGGDMTETRRLLTESLHLCLELENRFFLSQVYTCLAETALWEGELAQTEHWLVQSLAHSGDPQQNGIYTVERLWVAARLATAQQHYQRAATLFGLAEQMHGQVHYAIAGPMRALADAALATVRAALEPGIFAEAFVAGQQMSLEEAFATLLAPTPIAAAEGKTVTHEPFSLPA